MFADVSFDTSAVVQGPLTVEGNSFLIPTESGTLAVDGSGVPANLLHSFAEFSLTSDQSATFQKPVTAGGPVIANILARVTGGEMSMIKGRIVSEIEGANLFLMNPAGVVLGDGAQVDVPGAFNATTADYILLSDGRRFTATPGGDVTLLAAPPEAFGFLEALAGVEGKVRVTNAALDRGRSLEGIHAGGDDLHLIGRALVVENTSLKSAGGEIGLVAVGRGKAVVPLAATGRLAAGSPQNGPLRVGDSALSVSGADGGRIVLSGGDVEIDSSGIDADAKGDGSGGEIFIEADGRITLNNSSRVASFSTNGQKGGEIRFDAREQVRVVSGSQVIASATSSGDGGLIQIGGGGLTIDGRDAPSGVETRLSAQSNSTATGGGGNIKVDVSGPLEILHGGSIVTNTFGHGAGGNITIDAGSLWMDRGDGSTGDPGPTAIASATVRLGTSTPAGGFGDGGEVKVTVTGHARILNNATIETSTFTGGKAGRIDFQAGSLDIVGYGGPVDPAGDRFEFLTGILGLTTQSGGGKTGGAGAELSVKVDGVIKLLRGAQIDSSTFGTGAGGAVSVQAEAIVADRMGSDFFTGIGSDTELDGWGGNAGDVVAAADSIELRNGALISSSSGGAGNSGSVTVFADSISASGGGTATEFVFSTESGIVAGTRGRVVDGDWIDPGATGDAGSVSIMPRLVGAISDLTADDLVVLNRCDPAELQRLPFLDVSRGLRIDLSDRAEIAARVEGSGNGGSVCIFAPGGTIEVADGARISARSGVEGGTAGSVKISAGRLLVQPEGIIEVLAEAADAGGITIDGVEFVGVTGGTLSAKAKESGGNITVANTRYLIVDHSEITADAELGTGGNIEITSLVFLRNESSITADSESGKAGVVRIDSQVVLSGSEGEIEVDPLDNTDSLQPECTNRLPTKAGSFIKAGRGGTRRLPGGYLPSLRLVKAK